MSIEQQQSEQQVFDLERCQANEKHKRKNNLPKVIRVKMENVIYTLHPSLRHL